ncbi:hypothetical protein HY633_03055 [Candidatus Uhrbacteria bacterium]|nr:hypothetical protein [Candidatus Uhrbacteria bacterium]
MKTKFVDAENIRNTIETDFSGWGTAADFTFIPKGELWVDRQLKAETKLFSALARLERSLPKSPFRKIRQIAMRTLTDHSGDICVVETVRASGMTVRLIAGASVRASLDPYFLLGGHDLVYSYIPRNEIWVEARLNADERRSTLLHEIEERRLMKKGMSYADAHDYALAAERADRRRAGKAHFTRG